jgi:hypothetical protein
MYKKEPAIERVSVVIIWDGRNLKKEYRGIYMSME